MIKVLTVFCASLLSHIPQAVQGGYLDSIEVPAVSVIFRDNRVAHSTGVASFSRVPTKGRNVIYLKHNNAGTGWPRKLIESPALEGGKQSASFVLNWIGGPIKIRAINKGPDRLCYSFEENPSPRRDLVPFLFEKALSKLIRVIKVSCELAVSPDCDWLRGRFANVRPIHVQHEFVLINACGLDVLLWFNSDTLRGKEWPLLVAHNLVGQPLEVERVNNGPQPQNTEEACCSGQPSNPVRRVGHSFLGAKIIVFVALGIAFSIFWFRIVTERAPNGVWHIPYALASIVGWMVGCIAIFAWLVWAIV